MADTVINFPGLPPGMTLTTDVCNPTSLAVEEAVTLTEGSGIYSGIVAGAIAGQKVFVLKASGTRFTARVRTIADTVGPFTILSELEQLADDGRGEHLVTITIDDGTDPVEGAKVRITAAGVSVTKTTDADGIALFSLDNGPYVVLIFKAGYDTEIEALTVSGATPETYSLTAIEITESDPGKATGWTICYDENLEPEVGVPHTIQMIAGPGDAGQSLDQKTITVDSITGGLVQFPNMLHEATYSFWRGPATATPAASIFATRSSSTPNSIVVPVAGSFPLVEVLGTDAEA